MRSGRLRRFGSRKSRPSCDASEEREVDSSMELEQRDLMKAASVLVESVRVGGRGGEGDRVRVLGTVVVTGSIVVVSAIANTGIVGVVDIHVAVSM